MLHTCVGNCGARTHRDVCAGVLAVVRSNVAQDRPYTGLTEICSGEVAEDLASYLADSEQVRLCWCPSVGLL